MGGELEEVVVHDLVDGTYYGLLKLRVEGRDEPLLVDTRPSDGLALAARTGAAISISKKILEESPDYEFMAPQESDQVVRLSGLTLVAPTAEHREEFGLPEGPGILVTRATGMAARQGLQRGDLILEVNGEAMEAPVGFLQVLEDTPVGEALKLKLWHRGEEKTLDFYPDRRLPGEEPEEGPKQVASARRPGEASELVNPSPVVATASSGRPRATRRSDPELAEVVVAMQIAPAKPVGGRHAAEERMSRETPVP
jgi:hypothetical protein